MTVCLRVCVCVCLFLLCAPQSWKVKCRVKMVLKSWKNQAIEKARYIIVYINIYAKICTYMQMCTYMYTIYICTYMYVYEIHRWFFGMLFSAHSNWRYRHNYSYINNYNNNNNKQHEWMFAAQLQCNECNKYGRLTCNNKKVLVAKGKKNSNNNKSLTNNTS